jgi:hypothetical protein
VNSNDRVHHIDSAEHHSDGRVREDHHGKSAQKVGEQMKEEPNAEMVPEIHRAAIAFFEDLLAGRCPVCHEIPQYERQVGGCVIALPCGHRMGQGKAREDRIEPEIEA